VVDSPRGRAIGERDERAHGRLVAAGRQTFCAPGAVVVGGAVEDTRTGETVPAVTSQPVRKRCVDALVGGVAVDSVAGQGCTVVIIDALHVMTIQAVIDPPRGSAIG